MVRYDGRRASARRRLGLAFALGLGAAVVAAPMGSAAPKKLPPLPKVATTSSPIALAPDGKTVWVVNPDAANVSVIRTDTNRVIRRVSTDKQPRAIAIDPRGKYAYVANAEDNSVTIIQIQNPDPKRFRARRVKDLVTGAEPWNVVASPDGKRVFVSNSGQDTVTVINTATNRIIGSVDVGNSICNDPDRNRHFQPRGLAVNGTSRFLYVTSFFAFTVPGGRQGSDTGRAGAVCQIRINTAATRIGGYRASRLVQLAPQVTGFTVDSTGDGVADPTSAFPNQLQSIVIRGNQAYLPNVAASPTGPLRFNVDTEAYVNVIDGVNGGSPTDASAGKFLNLHLGARNPEAGKTKLFFANVWAVGFARRGSTENAYVVSAGSDLLVKLKVNRGSGKLDFTVDQDTTRYIDLNDPARAVGGAACRANDGRFVPASDGCAGKNPQGIAINAQGTRAYVFNYVSRNVTVVNLVNDTVLGTVRTQALPAPGSSDETVQVGAEVFFSSRGRFDRPAGATVSTNDRLSSEGWQSCASCHFEGLTDSVVWQFGTGPRKSVPLNATFNSTTEQRVLNYSAIFDEVEDFEANIRNVSGPGAVVTPVACATLVPPATNGTLDPNHGLLIGDDGDVNKSPCTVNAFNLANNNRKQLTVTLPGSSVQVPALTAMREWVRLAVRTPNSSIPAAPGRPGTPLADVTAGRNLFVSAGCQSCHSGGKWTSSAKAFISPPAAGDIATEALIAPVTPSPGNDPVTNQYLPALLKDIGSFGLGVPGGTNLLGNNIGADEKASATLSLVNGNLTSATAKDALGKDYNADGKGNGYNVPSLLGLLSLPPYYHNGACESLACVVGNPKHRTVNGTRPDGLVNPADQAKVVAFLESIDNTTRPLP